MLCSIQPSWALRNKQRLKRHKDGSKQQENYVQLITRAF